MLKKWGMKMKENRHESQTISRRKERTEEGIEGRMGTGRRRVRTEQFIGETEEEEEERKKRGGKT